MIKTVLFDFDGVIVDSMDVRDEGFRMIAKAATDKQSIVDEFIAYHRYNAGLSRFEKIKYLYETMLHQVISQEEVLALATEFSNLMKSKLLDKQIVIQESLDFIVNNFQKHEFHIVSGSEDKELNYLCEKLELSEYFISINGSPTHKNTLVRDIIKAYGYDRSETVLIGDSITDYDAAKANGITFYGYNNCDLRDKEKYIESFLAFKL